MITIDNKSFYPTPAILIDKMISKIKDYSEIESILEPSAGKGNIVERMVEKYHFRSDVFSVIEKDEVLQTILLNKGYKLIDGDFIVYSGNDKFDLIIANPPFDDGEYHLLKAIDIMYSGQIIFILNSETIKNPYTNIRKQLVNKLEELNSEIEYIPNMFKKAERKTGVEIALISIVIKRQVESDLFDNCDDAIKEDDNIKIDQNYEVSNRKAIPELVAEYNQTKNIGIETIIQYYKNYKKIGKYIFLNENKKTFFEPNKEMTPLLKASVNVFLSDLRKDFWDRTLNIQEVKSRMTSARLQEFYRQVKEHSNMDFTENNIRQFILNLVNDYENILVKAVKKIFDQFTVEHCYSGGLYEKNIHYFNGWKTNKAFKVCKKVIVPLRSYYGSSLFSSFSSCYKLEYGVENSLNDIDIVMNYFDGSSNYLTMTNAINDALKNGQTKKIVSKYFTIDCYKKGTVHLTFNSDDILRRFNIVACKDKKWLPHDYSKKNYSDLDKEEKSVVDNFEGEKSYKENFNKLLFAPYNKMQIEYKPKIERVKRSKL